jgi:hypothetical protein
MARELLNVALSNRAYPKCKPIGFAAVLIVIIRRHIYADAYLVCGKETQPCVSAGRDREILRKRGAAINPRDAVTIRGYRLFPSLAMTRPEHA